VEGMKAGPRDFSRTKSARDTEEERVGGVMSEMTQCSSSAVSSPLSWDCI